MMTARKPRILFIAEAVTLAHVARPTVLAGTLAPNDYDVHFAAADRFSFCAPGGGVTRWPLTSMSADEFLKNIAAGRPLFDTKTLGRYIDDDLRVLGHVQPDLVIGDLRLSLAVSCRILGVPYAAIINATWSPFAVDPTYPIPEHKLTHLFGVSSAQKIFDCVRPLNFRSLARPLRYWQQRHGLRNTKSWLQACTEADFLLYADTPELVPTARAPASHSYIGPIIWSPPVPLPNWWNDLPTERPAIYITLGSSGQLDYVPRLVEALAGAPYSVLLASAGRATARALPANFYSADYFPGEEAAKRASVVVCNGGSATAYQALSVGTPVIGLASNMDQLLTMAAIRRTGAGVALRPERVSARSIRELVDAMVESPGWTDNARRVSTWFTRYRVADTFPAFVDKALAATGTAPAQRRWPATA